MVPKFALWSSVAVFAILAGFLSPPDTTTLTAGEGDASYGVVSFPATVFDPGTMAFLLDIEPETKPIVEVWHRYERGGVGSSPDHAANFLVPTTQLGQEFDLRPTEVPEPSTPCKWSHVYRSIAGHGTWHAASLRMGEGQYYVNPNDGAPRAWRDVEPPANHCGDGHPIAAGLHWWIFTSTGAHSIEFTISNARFVYGPLDLGPGVMKVFTSGDFDSSLSASSLPIPGFGAFATMDASATISTKGPAYVLGQVTHHDSGPAPFRLLNPSGESVELRQKFYGAEGVFLGGGQAGVVAPLKIVQADLLHPVAGEWRAEIDSGAGTRMEFILYVVDLAPLADR